MFIWEILNQEIVEEAVEDLATGLVAAVEDLEGVPEEAEEDLEADLEAEEEDLEETEGLLKCMMQFAANAENHARFHLSRREPSRFIAGDAMVEMKVQ